ncbi:MAG: hypothetical protein ABL966_02260 [Acidimicrobiales bacterium]
MLHLLAGIAWDPQLRGFLAVGVGVVVLMGSVYLLLGTNLGARLGFLLAMSAIFGWCTIMGLTWWVYGTIGMLGEAPKWVVTEVSYASGTTDDSGLVDAALEEARTLDTSALPPPDELNDLTGDDFIQVRDEVEPTLGGWSLLPESNPSFGEAKATVDEHFVQSPNEELGLKGAADYVTVYSFERGGKDGLPDDPSRLDRITTKLKSIFWQVQHPPHFAIIQIQPVKEQATVPGEAPPTPVADPTQPVVSVIMERNLGDVRFPGAMLTIGSGLLFAITVLMLHRRDLRAAEARGISLAIPEA